MRRSTLRAASAFATAAVAVLAVPACALGAAKGLDTDLTWGTSSSTQQQTVATLQDAGATWTRLTISWHDVETSPGQYSSSALAAVDNAVSLARGRGINIDVDVLASPQWETGSSNQYAPPARPADYAAFVQAMAARYRGQVAAWEIWNEENIPRFWGGGVNAGQYAALLRAAYPAVKAGDPGAQVVFGGLSTNDYGFVDAAYAAVPNLGSYYDVMATHPYPGDTPPDLTVRAADGRIAPGSFDGYREVHQTMLAHGDGSKPIWFTEFGWSTYPGGVDATTQASDVTLAYECMQQDPYVQVAFYYNLRNNWWANDALDWEDQLGLLTTNFSQKPAYAAYKAYVPGTGGCAYRETGPGVQAVSPPGGGGSSGSGSGTPPAGGGGGGGPRIVVHLARRHHHRRSIALSGRIVGASAGSVVVEVERRSRGRWAAIRRMAITVGSDGSFSRLIRLGRHGRIRLRVMAGPGIRAATAGLSA